MASFFFINVGLAGTGDEKTQYKKQDIPPKHKRSDRKYNRTSIPDYEVEHLVSMKKPKW
jgi:hypothetical protein